MIDAEALKRDGYVALPGAVPRARVDRALRRIQRSFGEGGIPPERLPEFRARSFCPELRDHPDILALAEPAWPAVEALLGADRVRPAANGQIAVRFPQAEDTAPEPPHLDGVASPGNGVPEGTIHTFTALLAIYLSDVRGPRAGNFTVWPGTHLAHAAWFEAHGPESLLDGMPRVPLPEPRRLEGRAGDAFLCHYLLGHAPAPNTSPYPRYAVFFRLRRDDHEARRPAPMKDPWLEWPGVV